MKRRLAEFLFLLVAVALFAWLKHGPLSDGITRLDLKGTPGEFITQGKDWHFDTRHSQFRCRFDYSHLRGVSVYVDGPEHLPFNVSLAAPHNQLLQVGHYSGATRFPFHKDGPGLSVTGDGRGCNKLTGSFDILEIEYGPDGQPVRLAADFIQTSEGNPPRSFRGSVRFHSRLP
jgi:hypothetical protein